MASHPVIPVRVDDLPHGEMNIELTGLNTIDASTEWAGARVNW